MEPLGRVEWAEYLCADRSALTRELAKMKEEGILDYQRNIFEILGNCDLCIIKIGDPTLQ